MEDEGACPPPDPVLPLAEDATKIESLLLVTGFFSSDLLGTLALELEVVEEAEEVENFLGDFPSFFTFMDFLTDLPFSLPPFVSVEPLATATFKCLSVSESVISFERNLCFLGLGSLCLGDGWGG
jgi:hypothetical protein